MRTFRIFLINFLIMITAFGVVPGVVYAKDDPRNKTFPTEETEVFEPEATKIVLVDATPLDPMKIEWSTSYSITGSGKQFQTNGGRTGRKLFRESSFQSTVNFGVVEGFDIGITEGFSILADKENNYNEVDALIDPATGDPLEDTTDGPHKGHGWQDMTVNGRWRFYQSCDKTLRMAYVPYFVIPIGRRSNLDHLGPSQGYVSMGNTLAVTKDIKRWTMSGNLGYEVPFAHKKRRENSAGTMTLGGGAGYHIFDWIQPQIEMLYAQEFQSPGKGAKLFSMVFGAIIPVNDHLRFDVGMVQDIAGSGADQTTSGIFKLVLLT